MCALTGAYLNLLRDIILYCVILKTRTRNNQRQAENWYTRPQERTIIINY